MGRKKPESVRNRVQMYRERKKLLNDQNQEVIEHFLQINKENDSNTTTNNENYLKSELCVWANTHHISKRAINGLLSILNSNGLGNQIPKNYRTLQKTPIHVEINEIAGGKLWYNGLSNCLMKIFSTLPRDISISLNFNIDGLPLFNSSKISFWPILASVEGTLSKEI